MQHPSIQFTRQINKTRREEMETRRSKYQTERQKPYGAYISVNY